MMINAAQNHKYVACRGFAMLMVLLFVVIASVVGGSYLYATSIRAAISQNVLDATRATYLAESAVEHGIHVLIEGGSYGSESSPAGPYYADSSEDYYSFYVTDLGDGTSRLTGLGFVGQIKQTSSELFSMENQYDEIMEELNPKYWWKLDENSNGHRTPAEDAMDRRDGIYKEHVLLRQAGAIVKDESYCGEFSGSRTWIQIKKLSIAYSSVTVGVWVQLDDWGNADGRAIGSTKKSEYELWGLGTASQGKATAFFTTTNGLYQVSTVADTISTGEWIFMVATYDGNNIRLYLNGQLAASGSASGTIIYPGDRDNKGYIGGYRSYSSSTMWDGKIDEPFICNYALTSTQIQELFQARYPAVYYEEWEK